MTDELDRPDATDDDAAENQSPRDHPRSEFDPDQEGFPIPPAGEADNETPPDTELDRGDSPEETGPEAPAADDERKSSLLSDSEEALRRSQVASLLGRVKSADREETPATLPESPQGRPDSQDVVAPEEAAEPDDSEERERLGVPAGVPMGRRPEGGDEELQAPRAGAEVALTDLLGHRPPEAPDLSAAVGRWIRLLLVLAVLIALLSGALLAGVHIKDRYNVNMASGVWMGLARWVDEGVLYPPLFDEATQSYGGTRYMPLTIILHAGAAQFTGEYLASGKIVACGSAVLMLLAVLTMLLMVRCPPLLSLGLTGLIIVSPTGIQAITSIRGDALPIFIQLVALMLMMRKGDRTLPMVVVIGAICALAVLAKLSAGWATMAIGLWLLVKDRKGLLFFAAGFAGLLVAAGAILWVVTEGAFFSAVLSLTFAGSENVGGVALLAPRRLMEFTTEWAPICWALLPLAGLGFALRLSGGRIALHHLGLLCCLVVLLVIYADWGVGENHVLDLLVLSTIAVGDLAGQVIRQRRGMALGHGALAMVVILGTPVALLHKPLGSDEWVPRVGHDALEAIGLLAGRDAPAAYDPHPLEGMVEEGRPVLSEDPYVPVSLGRTPVVLDGFMLKRMDRASIDALVARIEDSEFCKVVLLREMETDSWWYRELFFGEAVSTAIAENYVFSPELTERCGGYYMYVPRVVVKPPAAP